MYLIYNRDYELVGEVKDFKQVKDNIGEDIREQDVNSLEFIRGKTVITEDNLKRLVSTIVSKEKSEVVDYITEEVESQEDETVELKTTNRHLQNKIIESKEYLAEISNKLGKVIGETKGIPDEKGKTKPTPTIPEDEVSEKVSKKEKKEEVAERVIEELEGGLEEEDIDLDEETKDILQHIKRNHKPSASKLVADKRKRKVTDINFISIIEGRKVRHIENLRGSKFIRTSQLAEDIGLDREHVEYLIDNVLTSCGGTPDYQNKSVVSPSEAVWVTVSALTKRDGFTTSQRFQKTVANAEDFYNVWEQQKEEIKEKLV